MNSIRCQVAAIVHVSHVPSGKGCIDERLPLLLTASYPLSEESWQFREAPKMRCYACLRIRRRADQDRSGSEPGCPTSGVSAVIDDQRLFRLHAHISEEARIILWPFFEGIDQVGPIETAKAVPHAHPFQSASQFQRARPGDG